MSPDPRFGIPPGFEDGFDDPTRGEFQPGTEAGAIDPNAAILCIALTNVRAMPDGALTALYCGGEGNLGAKTISDGALNLSKLILS